MALDNDELPKASDKTTDKLSVASGVTTKSTTIDEKPPKPIKEKTNLEELDEVELETLLKETLTYKSPRDRDCRSSLFNKLLVSAEDSIRKDSALNASGSEAVRHRNPQATSRSRYQQRGGNSTFSSGHQAGKHGTGGVGGTERKGGRNCTGAGGGSGAGSIADKGTLGGSLNNLTVEDLYESISQHLQQRPEKSVSARQRTGGSLPCNVNAGLITPCETSEPKSPNDTTTSPIIQQNCSAATITTVTTTASISPTVTTTTYCLTTSNCSSSSTIYGLSSNNTNVDLASDAVVLLQNPNTSHGTISSVSSCNSGDNSATTGKDSCVIEVEQDCTTGASGTDGTTSAGDMIGVKQPQSTTQTKPPLPSTAPPNNATTNFHSTNTNCSSQNTVATTILTATNNPLLGDGALNNIPHIDDDNDDYIVEEDDQHRRFQRQLNYATNDEEPIDGTGRRLQQALGGYEASLMSNATERASLSTADYYFLTFREEPNDKKQSDRDDVERRPLLLNMEGDEGAVGMAGSRVPSTGGGPMKIVGQGPQIKPNTTNSLHKQLLNSSIQHNATVTMPSQQTSPTPSPPNKRRSLNDINLNDLLKSPAPQHPSPLSHHHSAQQPHHQHTGAVRISSLSSSNMLNLNHRRLLQQQQQQQQQHFDNGESMDLMDEVVIGVPSTLTGTMGGGSGDGAGRAVGSFLSERTIHVGDVVESPASTRQSDQDAPTTCDVSKGYGILPNKKIDDNGNHVTKSRKKVKPPEAVVRAEEVEGHRGDIAFDINKLVAFINGNEDTVASGNVAKSAKTTKSSVKLQQQQQQHRGSVSGTGNNNRAGGKSVDAEHHSRRHQNHHHNQQNQQNSAQSSAATKYERQLHRANSLEEMPTTTLEEFHANESQNKSGSSKGGKQVNNQQNKVSQAAQQSSTEPNVLNKKASVNDGANVNNAAVVSSGESSVAVVGGGSSTNRGRGVLRVTKSGGSRSGGSAHRGSITRSGVNNSTSAGGVAVSAGESGGNLMQPRRSWTNADPSPLQAIQHGATTASAENLETDFTLVNSKKKKGKKQQQRRNSVGSRTPIITQPQTITSPPTNNRNNNHRYNNNHTNNSTTSDNHASSGGGDQQQQQQQQRLITVNVATSATGNSQSEDCSSSDGDNTAAHLLVAIDGGAPFVGSNQSTTISSPANLTSYASITKSNVATQQPTIHIPPQPQIANSNVNTPKWPIATTNTNTTTTITATTLTTIPNNGCVATNSNNTTTTTTTTATVVHPETVVVAVQLKVVTNRSQEQQTDDIVPTLVDANGGGDYVVAKQQQIGGGGGFERQQQIGGHPTTETDTKQHHQISTEPPSLNDMQRWPSINNNNNTNNNKSALHTNHIIEPPSDHQQDTSKSGNSSHIDNHQNVATWPTLGNPKHLKSTNVPIVSAADIASKDDVKIVTSDRVVVRSNNNNNKAMGVRGARDDRIIVKDVDARNKMNSARHGGEKHNLGAVHRPVEMQSYVVQHHNVIHPVLVTQHIHHPQHIAPQVISLIPITKLPPPNLIDHTTPPPPNFIQPQQQQQHHHLNQHYQPYAQAPQHIIVQNNVLYTPIHLPANIPDVQMIEHQMQLQHNNNVHTKNTYNQNSAADGKGNSKSMDYQQKYHNDQQSVYQEQLPPPAAVAVDYQLQVTRRPPVVIMRDLSINSPMGDGGRVAAATADDDDNDDDMSCCELTFGFDVNEELLSLHDENYSNVSECQSQGVDGEITVDDGCTLKDVSAMFARRFVAPDIQAEFNYEKIVDYVANAWHETIADSSDGKCNFYQDL